MRGGRPKADLALTEVNREILERWSRLPKTAQALALRSRIILRCGDGVPNKAVSAEMPVKPQTVGKWRSRFLERGVDGLMDEPQPAAPRKVSDATIERLITKTLESAPTNATLWSTRSIRPSAPWCCAWTRDRSSRR